MGFEKKEVEMEKGYANKNGKLSSWKENGKKNVRSVVDNVA